MAEEEVIKEQGSGIGGQGLRKNQKPKTKN